MTLLHFACKAGAAGIGDPQVAAEVVQDLISRCADVYARCTWTQMTPLHYSALFDASAIIQILLNASQAVDIDGPCNDYENGSALHIAAANLAFNSAVVLVEFGANTKLKDNLGRTPFGNLGDQFSADFDQLSFLKNSAGTCSGCRLYSGQIQVSAHAAHGRRDRSTTTGAQP